MNYTYEEKTKYLTKRLYFRSLLLSVKVGLDITLNERLKLKIKEVELRESFQKIVEEQRQIPASSIIEADHHSDGNKPRNTHS